uniref:TNF receptor superfamily member 25 n=1 Tax=Nothoprocta perdicaria TaxID=30464 RepID=A0A8C6Z3J5_NOTPE
RVQRVRAAAAAAAAPLPPRAQGRPAGPLPGAALPSPPCHTGTFLRSPCTSRVNDSVCEPCPAGTFHSLSNTALSCKACYECDRQALQSVLSNCSATSNIVCSCEAGYYKECIDNRCSNFHCRECRTCAGSLVDRPCEHRDTQCGSCKPNFYAEGGNRGGRGGAPCPPHTPGSSLAGAGLEYLLLGLAGPLFLGALAIYHKRLRQDASGCSPLPASPRRSSPDPAPEPTPGPAANLLSAGVSSCREPRCHQPGPATAVLPETMALLQWCRPHLGAQPKHLLQGSQLYAIIDAVPLRRWKEFMRVLGLRDTDIEVVELEFAHVRDQQYEMLKRWGQQSSASLSHVFAALERMELEGCAQALRLRLQDCP